MFQFENQQAKKANFQVVKLPNQLINKPILNKSIPR